MPHVTLRDIARLVGVSTSSVSRALNNKAGVHPYTKDKVLRVTKRLGYVPNSIALSLRSRKTRALGVIIADISNPFFASVVAGIEDEALHDRRCLFFDLKFDDIAPGDGGEIK